jgi:hypothetical protein
MYIFRYLLINIWNYMYNSGDKERRVFLLLYQSMFDLLPTF